MAKLLDLFNSRQSQGQVYRKTPVKQFPDGDPDHPLRYVYPDGEMIVTPKKRGLFSSIGRFILGRKDSPAGAGALNTDLINTVKDDIVLAEESVSVTRDRDRITKFEKTQAGARFLQTQIELQRANTFVSTRPYRKDNIKDHTNPTVHKPRHGKSFSLQSLIDLTQIPGEFSNLMNPLTGEVAGKTQDETSQKIGMIYPLRLGTREGMLNTAGLTPLTLAANAVRRKTSNWLNNLLAPLNRQVTQLRSRIFATSAASERPEIEYDYLRQVWDANRGVRFLDSPLPGQQSGVGGNAKDLGHRYGHIYLQLEAGREFYEGTYFDHIRTAHPSALGGFKGYRTLGPGNGFNSFFGFSASAWFDKIQSKAGQWATRQINKVLGKVSSFLSKVSGGRLNVSVAKLKAFGSQFLPKTQDILLLRSLKRFTVDIDNMIARLSGGGSSLKVLEDDEFGGVNLKAMYEKSSSKLLRDINKEHGDGQSALRKYVEELAAYKGRSGKRPSLGFSQDGGNVSGEGNAFLGGPLEDRSGAKPDGGAHAWDIEEKRYYKDLSQLTGTNADPVPSDSIFKRDIRPEYDSDSIDVIFEVMGTSDEAVRFRALIEDISESVSPSYNESKYIGRYETFYTYDKVTRDLSFKLRLQAWSENESVHIMGKMAYLTSLAYPESSGGSGPGYLTPLITQLTIGNVYTRQPCLVQSISHAIESDVSWDLLGQVPMSIVVDMQVRLLDKKLYTYRGMENDTWPFSLYLKDIEADTSLAGDVAQSILGDMTAPIIEPIDFGDIG